MEKVKETVIRSCIWAKRKIKAIWIKIYKAVKISGFYFLIIIEDKTLKYELLRIKK